MLSHGELARHEASLKRRLIRYGIACGVVALGFLLRSSELVIIGLIATYAVGWGLFMFMWKDLTLRGRSSIWAYFIGVSPLGLIVWLIWRRAHPIRTP